MRSPARSVVESTARSVVESTTENLILKIYDWKSTTQDSKRNIIHMRLSMWSPLFNSAWKLTAQNDPMCALLWSLGFVTHRPSSKEHMRCLAKPREGNLHPLALKSKFSFSKLRKLFAPLWVREVRKLSQFCPSTISLQMSPLCGLGSGPPVFPISIPNSPNPQKVRNERWLLTCQFYAAIFPVYAEPIYVITEVCMRAYTPPGNESCNAVFMCGNYFILVTPHTKQLKNAAPKLLGKKPKLVGKKEKNDSQKQWSVKMVR